MGFRRLFGIGGDAGEQEPPEIDTQITTVAPRPGSTIEGQVVLKGGSKGLHVEWLNLDVIGKAHSYNGSLDDDEIVGLSTDRHQLTLAPGEEKVVTFTGELPWECPVTELHGQALGVDVSLVTRLNWESSSPVRDLDFLHIAAPPLYEAVLDAFAEEGYHVDNSQLIDEYIPHAEAHRGTYQIFFLTDRSRGVDRFAELEVVFHQNMVGAMVYVRRAARATYEWSDKPPARRFPVAHHEVGRADVGERARKALAELPIVDS
ncbi:sporulation protein [Streptomyces sp. NPDC053367]|uniref:sporulation protein n=1 Tax=Streptomyces sp. NPDC053367 TaxID=3365700 RepID=UPI0037D4DF09